jgi:hypothetical protein
VHWKGSDRPPAMAAGVTDKVWDIAALVAMIEATEPAPAKRGPYKKRMVVWENIIRDSKAESYRSSMVRLLVFGAK